MVPKYIASLAVVVIFVSLAATQLRFASRSQVRSGATIEEAWKLEFTLDAGSNEYYRISPTLQRALESGIDFTTEGPVHVDSATVQITPKDVSWSESRTTYTAPGAGLVAQVKWETSTDAANGSRGALFMNFPEVPGNSPNFHSGSYHMDSRRCLLRGVTTFQSPIMVFFARMGIALAAGLPFGILLHSIWWGFELRKEKRARIAALPPQGSQLPRTFYPNPIAEWSIWTILFAIFSAVACVLAGISIADGILDPLLAWFIYGAVGLAALGGLIAAYFTGRSVLTVKVDSNGIMYAKGRGDLQWLIAQWGEMSQLTEKSRTYRGTRREWVEIKFRDLSRKKLKISQDIEGYKDLKSILFSVFTPAKPA